MKKIVVILAEGFEETEAVTIIDVLRRADVAVTAAGLDGMEVTGAHAITVKADTTLASLTETTFDGVILPGGMGGTENLLASSATREFLQRHAREGKITAAICAAPWVLAEADLLTAREATIYPGLEGKITAAKASGARVVKDGQIITSKGPATAMDFALALVEEFCGPDKADEVAQGLLYKK